MKIQLLCDERISYYLSKDTTIFSFHLSSIKEILTIKCPEDIKQQIHL